MPDHAAWPRLHSWWLKHKRGANTPNWDIAVSCHIEGQPGLILVEAKAHERELEESGKRAERGASAASQANHDRIGGAISEACTQLSPKYPGISLDRDTHYQTSNRIAFAWKLASLGIPTVMIYLGFIGDEGIRNVGTPFRDQSHWLDIFEKHLASVCPTSICNAATQCGEANFWLLPRARHVLQVSPPTS
jgi:hypothetical protein